MTLTLDRDRRTNEVIVTGPDLELRFDGTMVNTNVMGAVGKLLNEIYEAGVSAGRVLAPATNRGANFNITAQQQLASQSQRSAIGMVSTAQMEAARGQKK